MDEELRKFFACAMVIVFAVVYVWANEQYLKCERQVKIHNLGIYSKQAKNAQYWQLTGIVAILFSLVMALEVWRQVTVVAATPIWFRAVLISAAALVVTGAVWFANRRKQQVLDPKPPPPKEPPDQGEP